MWYCKKIDLTEINVFSRLIFFLRRDSWKSILGLHCQLSLCLSLSIISYRNPPFRSEEYCNVFSHQPSLSWVFPLVFSLWFFSASLSGYALIFTWPARCNLWWSQRHFLHIIYSLILQCCCHRWCPNGAKHSPQSSPFDVVMTFAFCPSVSSMSIFIYF